MTMGESKAADREEGRGLFKVRIDLIVKSSITYRRSDEK